MMVKLDRKGTPARLARGEPLPKVCPKCKKRFLTRSAALKHVEQELKEIRERKNHDE